MVKKEEAMRYLGDVSPEKYFWMNNGTVLKNLYELQDGLESISEETYGHHVSKEKNDFAKWVGEVVGDGKLAKELVTARNRESAFNKARNRINTLKMVVG